MKKLENRYTLIRHINKRITDLRYLGRNTEDDKIKDACRSKIEVFQEISAMVRNTQLTDIQIQEPIKLNEAVKKNPLLSLIYTSAGLHKFEGMDKLNRGLSND